MPKSLIESYLNMENTYILSTSNHKKILYDIKNNSL